MKGETESERAARKEREEEEQRQYEEEARRSKERRSKLDRLSLKGEGVTLRNIFAVGVCFNSVTKCFWFCRCS